MDLIHLFLPCPSPPDQTTSRQSRNSSAGPTDAENKLKTCPTELKEISGAPTAL